MTEVYIALGTNVEPGLARLRSGVSALRALGEVLAVSSVYRSAPYGYTDQEPFLNAAVRMRVQIEPVALLRELKNLEREQGRIPRPRWQEREIDYDIIFYGNALLQDPELAIPHPDYRNRAFVVFPLLELSSQLVDPLTGESLKEIAARLNNDLEKRSDSLVLSTRH